MDNKASKYSDQQHAELSLWIKENVYRLKKETIFKTTVKFTREKQHLPSVIHNCQARLRVRPYLSFQAKEFSKVLAEYNRKGADFRLFELFSEKNFKLSDTIANLQEPNEQDYCFEVCQIIKEFWENNNISNMLKIMEG